MSLRRSSRAASTKPVTNSASGVSSVPRNKRPASPERTDGSAPKRTRIAAPTKKSNNAPPAPARKARSTTKPVVRRTRVKPEGADEVKVRVPKEKPAPLPQSKPYLNALPVPPQPTRPGLVTFAWGAGNFGQFGMGPDVLGELSKPRRNPWVEEQIAKGTFGGEGAGVESIAAGGLHTLFVDEKGTVWSCGVNDNAALGRITTNVPDPDNEDSFLDIDELISWPRPIETLVEENFRAVRVAAGDSIGAAISDKGEFRTWGTFRGVDGALGFSDGKDKQDLPTPILDLKSTPGDYEKVTSVAAGANHIVACTTHGNIYTFGAGEQGQLGRKILERRKIRGTQPAKISLATRSRKGVDVGAGSFHSFAIDNRGDVWAWGLNNWGQTGTGWSSSQNTVILQPKKVEALSAGNLGSDRVVQVAGGEHHSLFLTREGKVYACGRMDGGQLGLEDDNSAVVDWKLEYEKNFKEPLPQFLPEPTLVTFPDMDDPITQVSCGIRNSAAVTKGGALYSWGQGMQGELGCGDEEEEVRIPRVVVRKEGGSWTAHAVSCGGQHTNALLSKKI